MKLMTFLAGGKEQVGVVTKDGSAVVPLADHGFLFSDMNALVETATKEQLASMAALANENGLPLSQVQPLAPIVHPKQDIICLGINYMAHAEESMRYKKEAFGGDRQFPVYFSKRVTRASADGDDIPTYADLISTLDYEAELAVIIGKDAKNVAAEDAKDYIFGYTVMNDVTARELQTRHKQWYFGKSLDGFTPLGPVIVTADEVAYPPVLNIRSYVNGELRQNAATDLFIHDIDYVIHELSQGMTLQAGTIIATGTPAGVGMGFEPPKFLKSGDEVICEIEGIGRITNKVK